VNQPENTEVYKVDDLHVGADSYGIYYPFDGFMVGGYTRETAQDALINIQRYRVPNNEGAYIVKYSIERVGG
jgi:hypothetical protein